MNRYLVAVLSVAVALGVRLALAPWLLDETDFLPFLFAIAVTAVAAGTRPGFLATALSVPAAIYFLAQPTHSFWIESPAERLQLVLFCVMAGGVCWLSGSLHDARRRVEGERVKLWAERERFRLAADAVNGIIYEFNFKTGHVERSRGLTEVLGYHADEVPPTAAWWQEQVHPDDREPARRRFEDAAAAGNIVVTEYRVRHKDGRWLHVEDRAILLRGEDIEPVKLVGCTMDVTARKQADAELAEADRRKDEFLATLAHELRNPLAPIRNGLQIMKLAGGNPDAVEKSRGMMERQVGQMTHLIDDLMDLSRIRGGKIVLQKARLKVSDVVQDAVDTSRPLIEERGHDLVVDAPPEPLYVDADRTRLVQVFGNLLNNAAKYTERGGRIRVAVERQGSDVTLAVEDNGTGIPAHMLTRVFDMFAQVDRSLERSQGGLGIGLNIVKRLVEMHDGGIVAESGGHGTGSRFVVRLPVALTVTTDRPDEHNVVPKVRLSRRRILVVDDSEDGATSLAEMLNIMGNDTQTAFDGVEAVAVAEAFKPDVILMDIGMPKLNGFDACRRIREQPWGRNTVIVAQTGRGQEDDKRRSQDAGFDFHMVKPVTPDALEKLLATCRADTG